MNKTEAAAALREAADRIEACKYAGKHIDVNIHFHCCNSRSELLSVLAIARDDAVKQNSNEGTHWAAFLVQGLNFAAFFDPSILGEVTEKKTVVRTVVRETVAALLGREECEDCEL